MTWIVRVPHVILLAPKLLILEKKMLAPNYAWFLKISSPLLAPTENYSTIPFN
jgi:hypothetical protein